MSPFFRRLPGFARATPGLEHRLWRRLPALTLWGTLGPVFAAVLLHLAAPPHAQADAPDPALLLWDYTLAGVVVLHWTLVLTLAIGCFIVRVMKGPAYVADAYPVPETAEPGERPPVGDWRVPGRH